MTETSEEYKSIEKCKNCGCHCTSNFCPDCGQSVSEKRLDSKTFFIEMITGLSRINKGFLYTAWNLFLHPWRVIRDYVQCRRVRYVAPIPMLILVCFVSAFIGALVSDETNPAIADVSYQGIPMFYRILMYIGNFVLTNPLAQNLTIYVPALVAIPIVYGRVGAKKYNMAEYLTAMIYMAATFLIFDVITLPVSIISPALYSTLGICYSILICAASMYFAFPMTSGKRRVGYFTVYLLTVLLIYMVLFMILGMIISLARITM